MPGSPGQDLRSAAFKEDRETADILRAVGTKCTD